MGKSFMVIKYVFIFYNVLVAILGIVALIGTIFLTVTVAKMDRYLWELDVAGLLRPWLITFGIFSLSALGIYGTCREKKTQLIVFCVQMGIITVYMVNHSISLTVHVVKVGFVAYQHQMESVTLSDHAMIGICWGVGAFALLGALLSGLMVRHIKNRRSLVGSHRRIPCLLW